MVRKKVHYDWMHTSSMMALHANMNRSKNTDKTFDYTDFHPYVEGKRISIKELRMQVQGMKRG